MKSRRHSVWCLVSGLCGWLWQWLNPHEAVLLQVNCDLHGVSWLARSNSFSLVHWRRVHGWRAARWTAGIEATEVETNPRATFLVVLGNVFECLECRSPIFWDVFFCMFRFPKTPAAVGFPWFRVSSCPFLLWHPFGLEQLLQRRCGILDSDKHCVSVCVCSMQPSYD